jgi:hypothetical protein
MSRALSLLAIATAAALATAAAPGSATAGGCARVSLTGQATLNPATGTVDGTLVGTIDGLPASVMSSTTILGREHQGTILVLRTSHVLTLGDGTRLATVDKARLAPSETPGLFHASARVEIVSGGGGYLVGTGTIDVRTGLTATWSRIRGLICDS